MVKNNLSNDERIICHSLENLISGAGVSPDLRNNDDMPLSIKEATEFLGISRSVLYRLLNERAICSFYIKKRRFIMKSALINFIHKQEEAEKYGW